MNKELLRGLKLKDLTDQTGFSTISYRISAEMVITYHLSTISIKTVILLLFKEISHCQESNPSFCYVSEG
jgi:hypothetical protein